MATGRCRRLAGLLLVLVAAFFPPALADEWQRPAKLDQAIHEIRSLLDGQQQEQAKQSARRLVEETASTYGTESREHAEALDALVDALFRGGEFRAAETTRVAEDVAALRESLQGPRHPDLARSLLMLAQIRYFDQRSDEALELFERSLEIRREAFGPMHVEVAQSLHFIGMLSDERGEPGRAREYLDRALAIRETLLGPAHRDVGESFNYLASHHYRQGDFETALSHYTRAAEIFERAEGASSPRVAKAVYNQGLIQQILGRYREARASFERSLDVHIDRVGADHARVHRIRGALASLLHAMGDYAGARAQYEAVLEGTARTSGADSVEYAVALGNLASLLRSSGSLDEARKLHERALAIVQTPGSSRPDLAVGNLASLAWLSRAAGDRSSARKHYTKALELQRSLSDEEHPRVAEALTGLAECQPLPEGRETAERQFAEAVGIYERTLGEDHPALVRPIMSQGELALSVGEPSVARGFFARALRIAERVDGAEGPERAAILEADSHAQARLRQFDGALDTALRAAAIASDHVKLTARGLAEREALTYAAHMKNSLDLALSLALANPRFAAADVSRLFDAQIHSRALVLDQTAARNRTRATRGDPELDRLWERLRAEEQVLANLLVRGPEDLPLDRYTGILSEARKRRDRAELELAARSSEFSRRLATERLGLEDVRAHLPSGSVLVAFTAFDRSPAPAADDERAAATSRTATPHYAAFIVRSDRQDPVLVDLGKAAVVDACVGSWHRQASTGVLEDGESRVDALTDYRRAGAALRRRIWDPLAEHLKGANRIFFVPDGSINLVNFAALPVDRDRYLIETAPAMHLLSAERDLISSGPPEQGTGLLVLGSPDYWATGPFAALAETKSAPSPAPLVATRQPAGPCRDRIPDRFAPLPATRLEIDEVAALWSEDDAASARSVLRLTGAEATETAFKRSASGRRVLHLATHGFFLDGRCGERGATADLRGIGGLAPRDDAGTSPTRSPLHLSGLVLAGANRRDEAAPDEDDGILTAGEIATLDLSGTEWAVLSACETGIGEIRAGEGVFGLRRAFRVAGAGTVIMSLWSVEDATTRAWMERLYRGRLAGLETSEAVRRASLEMLRALRTAGLGPHPFFWAAFVASGTWK